MHFFTAIGKKLPPAPGCVDQQLTALSTELVHNELAIPQAPASTPYALQILLDMFRVQYMNMINDMKTPAYRINVENHIKQEKVSVVVVVSCLDKIRVGIFKIVLMNLLVDCFKK